VLPIAAKKDVSRSDVVGWELNLRGPFERFVDWRQCDAVIQTEAVTVMPSCSGGGNVVVA
jgi:hypothetical protein